jgi:NitT/TauT family transport system permease protein
MTNPTVSSPSCPLARRRAAARIFNAALLPLSVIVVLVGWELVVRGFGVAEFVVPAPSRVFQSLVTITTSGILLDNFLVTFKEALGGFILALVCASLFSAVITQSSLAERLLYPYFTALQSMPKVAIAPLVIIWFGYGLGSKVILAGLLAFFPMLVNFVEGLKSADEGRLKLMRAMDASPWQVLRYVKIPYALPFFLVGIELGGLYSILGAIVGEFVGSSAGIGNWLVALNVNLDTATTFALLIVLAVYGVAFQKLISLFRYRVLFWARRSQTERTG